MRHVVCIANNLEQTSPVQQKMVFLLLAVFKTNSVSGIVLPWEQEPDESHFQFSFWKNIIDNTQYKQNLDQSASYKTVVMKVRLLYLAVMVSKPWLFQAPQKPH